MCGRVNEVSPGYKHGTRAQAHLKRVGSLCCAGFRRARDANEGSVVGNPEIGG